MDGVTEDQYRELTNFVLREQRRARVDFQRKTPPLNKLVIQGIGLTSHPSSSGVWGRGSLRSEGKWIHQLQKVAPLFRPHTVRGEEPTRKIRTYYQKWRWKKTKSLHVTSDSEKTRFAGAEPSSHFQCHDLFKTDNREEITVCSDTTHPLKVIDFRFTYSPHYV